MVDFAGEWGQASGDRLAVVKLKCYENAGICAVIMVLVLQML